MKVLFILLIVIVAVVYFAMKQNLFKKFAFNAKVPANVQKTYRNDEVTNSWNETMMTDRTVAYASSVATHPSSNDSVISGNYNTLNTNHFEMLDKEIRSDTELNLDVNNIRDNSIHDLENMNKVERDPLVVKYDEKGKFVISINGKFSNIVVKTAEDALHSLYSVKTLLGLEDPETQLILDSESDIRSGKSFTFKQYYNSIEVLGYNITVSVDCTGKTCSLQSCIIDNKLMKKFIPTTTPSLSLTEIKQLVQEQYPEGTRISSSLIIYSEKSYSEPTLAYYNYITSRMDRSMTQVAILDAMTGKILYEDSSSF